MQLPPLNVELTVEEKFELFDYEQSAKELPRETLEKLLIDLCRQKIVVDNVNKLLIKTIINA